MFGTSHGAVQFMVYEEMKKGYCNYYGIPITGKLVSYKLLNAHTYTHTHTVLFACTVEPPVISGHRWDPGTSVTDYRGVLISEVKVTIIGCFQIQIKALYNLSNFILQSFSFEILF